MNILGIYKNYQIMPILQQHHLRTASVAKLISDNATIDVNCENIVKACLLHDMGNIVKFDLTYIPDAVEPEGLKYWQNVKEEFINKYGPDEHTATKKIIREITNDNEIHKLVESIGFSRSCNNLKINDYAKKICCYSDHRVTPFGISSLEERMQEGRKRFKRNKGDTCGKDHFEKYVDCMRELEKQIFKKCKIKAEDINDKTIKRVIVIVKEYDL